MIIWKKEVPYIVKTVDDLVDVIDVDIFECVKKLIEDDIQDSDEVDRLRGELNDLKDEISFLEEEIGDLKTEILELKDKLANYEQLQLVFNDFKDVIKVDELSKDQRYFFEQLLDIIAD